MEQELLLYRQQIDEQPICSELSFQENLTRYRAGDEMGARLISSTCLRIAYEIAMKLENPPSALDPFGRIEVANAGLVQAIDSFTGSSVEEFIPHARQTIIGRLDSWRGKAA